MKEDKFIPMFKRHMLGQHGSLTNVAKFYRVTPAFIGRIFAGDACPNKRMLDDIGYERVKTVDYRKV